MPLLSQASNVVQNVFFLYDVTGFTQIGHSIPVATNWGGNLITHLIGCQESTPGSRGQSSPAFDSSGEKPLGKIALAAGL